MAGCYWLVVTTICATTGISTHETTLQIDPHNVGRTKFAAWFRAWFLALEAPTLCIRQPPHDEEACTWPRNSHL